MNRRYVRPDGLLWFLQTVVPRGLQTQCLDVIHAGPVNGHPGIEKTQLKLQETVHWRRWGSGVRAYVGHCHECGSGRRGPRHRSGSRWNGDVSDGERRVSGLQQCSPPVLTSHRIIKATRQPVD